MPPSGAKTWKLPAVIPKVIRSCPLEEFTVGDDGAKPRLARKQIIQRVLEHPHVDRANHMGKLLKGDEAHIGNLVHVTDHHDGLIRYGSMNGAVGVSAVRQTAQDALALILLTCPRVLILGRLVSFDDHVFDLVEPFGEALLIFVKIQRFGPTHVIHLGLDKYEPVNVPVEALETELEHIELVIKHECVYKHL
jgi:hypothetical protein